jgi:hypothetical protein
MKSEINNELDKIIININTLDNKTYQYQFVLYEKTGKIFDYNDKKLFLKSSDNIMELNKRVKIKGKIIQPNNKRLTEEINEVNGYPLRGIVYKDKDITLQDPPFKFIGIEDKADYENRETCRKYDFEDIINWPNIDE